ncbi:MAG TPA: class I SAM-dependent methyltransferase [Bryobacteraceae bacterium]|jgi:trans-aconitate methyltransferase|nr:class I SAM-dependent methyltransferase [Bryobacteraceae bacterium]
MKDLFRRTPLQQFSEYSTSHLHAGTAYHARFRDKPGRAVMWALEQDLIKDIFKNLAPRCVLDFATGTGRIVSTLEKALPDCEFHGIDISQDMLTIARAECKRTKFHEMDGRQALNEFGKEAFDAVSAFRFFPNADPPLRDRVAEQISGLTKTGGHVIVNNHRNFWSTSYVGMRASGNSEGNYGSSNAAIKDLFLRRGFSCVRQYSLGVWPQSDFRPLLLSWSVTSALERFNLRHLSRLHSLGYNTIFVFRKTP